MPIVRVIDQTERFDVAFGEFKALAALIVECQDAPFCESALDGSQRFARKAWNCRGSTRDDRSRTFEAVEIILPITGKHGADFCKSRIHLLAQGSVREMVDEFATNGERARFLGREHYWREMIAFDQTVADAGLADDGNASFTECREIAINR